MNGWFNVVYKLFFILNVKLPNKHEVHNFD